MAGFQFDSEEDEDIEGEGMDLGDDTFGPSEGDGGEQDESEDESETGNETITRLKNDLFAEDEEISDGNVILINIHHLGPNF